MKALIVGGAGFIGSCCVERLLERADITVTVYDNFSSGRRWHLEPLMTDGRVAVEVGDVLDLKRLIAIARGHDIIFHFASNPDIAKAAVDPTIDFVQGTQLSQNVVEAARQSGVPRIVYASGSGVFGDNAEKVFDEDDFTPRPTSTYAASKIAGEALLSSYCYMFGLQGLSYRFANVVGAHQTHGVAYDFIRQLRSHPQALIVMGNGTQTKSYIHVDDIVAALLHFLPEFPSAYDYFNLTTEDSLTVKEIAQIVIDEMELTDVEVQYGTGDRGWKGDVPRIRFSAGKMRQHGWQPRRTAREAMKSSVRGMLAHATKGRFD